MDKFLVHTSAGRGMSPTACAIRKLRRFRKWEFSSLCVNAVLLVAPTTTLEGLVVDKECCLDIFEKEQRVSLVNIIFGLRKDVTITKIQKISK